MNDPWDVKSVRQSNQYESCIKINGVPLLPPVLSKECRKEMQYYKLLAKEVEKRISILKPYVDDDSDSEDKTDAPELPEHEQNYDIVAVTEDQPDHEKMDTVMTDVYNSITSNVTLKRTETTSNDTHNYVIDLNVSINETSRNVTDQVHSTTPTPMEVPERDCDYKAKPEKEVLTDVEETQPGRTETKNDFLQEIELMNLNFSLDDDVSDPILDRPLTQDGPPSLTSKSFTGSLRDIHTESGKVVPNSPKLLRQRSYTLLNPSPQLLAHLEVQSLNTGMDVNSISMSDSLSNICLPNKKRRSWDLETAKIKWSSMALELKKTNVVSNSKPAKANNGAANNTHSGVSNSHAARAVAKKSPPISPSARSQSVVSEKNRRGSINSKTSKEVVPKSKNFSSPTKVASEKPVREPISPTNKASAKEHQSKTNRLSQKKQSSPPIQNAEVEKAAPKNTQALISSAEDPAAAVNELYEKIQKQQLLQMANLVEKQKREQMLLQQVFEEQNHILFNQLKSICPQSSLEIKRAWGDKEDTERGPVSLRQLISHNAPDKSDTSISTLTETNSYINHCDDVLKKSRDITNSIKKQQATSKSANGKLQTDHQPDGSRTRTHSPTARNYSRKLTYESASEQYDPILTDRTNDTMADLNVTFPSDSEERSYYSNPNVNRGTEVALKRRSPVRGKAVRATDSAIRNLEDTIQNTMNTMCGRSTKSSVFHRPPTAQERLSLKRAAASKIVAYARGYLVRRLMRTERVQATVQTIRDALLCALQLHTERDGIRGADVDLHRRLIQQITAACYSLHDTFVASSPSERCAVIAADRARRRAHSGRQATPRSIRQSDVTETFSDNKFGASSRSRYVPAPRRRPWR